MPEVLPPHWENNPQLNENWHIRLLNHLPGMAYRCKVAEDYRYTLDFVSKGGAKLLGMPIETLLQGKTNVIEQMMRDEDLHIVRDTIRDKAVAHEPYEISYHITLDSGEEKWVWDQGEGVYDSEGTCVFLEGIMMDITEQQAKIITLQHENRQLQSSIKNSYGLGDIVGKSESMQTFYQYLLQAAKSDMGVVLYGETGVGKDLSARTIHELSGLKGRYVPVNCGAIPEQLFESEFFGHVKGAFSGAVSNQTGDLGAAHNGTLFLDEVAELPMNLQVKLLRAIESKSYTPVGSNEVKRSNFRVISATNRNMQDLVRAQKMRADLFYRLHVLAITIPPLRDRLGDLPLLIDMYAKKRGFNEPIPPVIYLAMERYHWPGNIRELQNALDRYWAFGDLGISTALTNSQELATNGLLNISGTLPANQTPPKEDQTNTNPPKKEDTSLYSAREIMEKHRIIAALEANRWKKGETAKYLGISLRTLQRKVKRYGINN